MTEDSGDGARRAGDTVGKQQQRVLVLWSNTGGGHRASAEMLKASLPAVGAEVVASVDLLVACGRWPLRTAPEAYVWQTATSLRRRLCWWLPFMLTNSQRRASWTNRLVVGDKLESSLHALLDEHRPDVVVSAHPLLTTEVSRVLRQRANDAVRDGGDDDDDDAVEDIVSTNTAPTAADAAVDSEKKKNVGVSNNTNGRAIPFVVLVSDLVTAHASWFDQDATLTLVPTESLKQHVVKQGWIAASRLKVVGQPLHPRFMERVREKASVVVGRGTAHPPSAARPWDGLVGEGKDALIVLIGGGDGTGPLREVAHLVAAAGLRAQVVVVCGKNEAVRAQLESDALPNTHVLGFERDMPGVLASADVAVTKAGPGGIMEAFACGVPVLLFDYIPGQEDGNIVFAEEAGAGRYVPRPNDIAAALREWIVLRSAASSATSALTPQHATASAAALRAATPHSAGVIAQAVVDAASGRVTTGAAVRAGDIQDDDVVVLPSSRNPRNQGLLATVVAVIVLLASLLLAILTSPES